MIGTDKCEVRPGVIYDWKTMVGTICGKVCFESGVKERSGDTDENGGLA